MTDKLASIQECYLKCYEIDRLMQDLQAKVRPVDYNIVVELTYVMDEFEKNVTNQIIHEAGLEILEDMKVIEAIKKLEECK